MVFVSKDWCFLVVLCYCLIMSYLISDLQLKMVRCICCFLCLTFHLNFRLFDCLCRFFVERFEQYILDSSCFQSLEGEIPDFLGEADFLKEKLKIEEEERKDEAAIPEIEKQNAQVNGELKELEIKYGRFKELEEPILCFLIV